MAQTGSADGRVAGDTVKAPSALQRELRGITLLLAAAFLAGALLVQGLNELGSGPDVRGSFGWAGNLLASPLARLLGWPAAALLPLALGAHALRLFGRLEAATDRSWLVFLLGLATLLPVAFGLAQGATRDAGILDGIWGSFVAFYLNQFAGTAGAWIIVALALSGLMAATLSWNPVRALVGRSPKDVSDRASASAVSSVRRGTSIFSRLDEPPPHEMPVIDAALMDEAAEAIPLPAPRDARTRGKRSNGPAPAATADARIAAAIDATARSTGSEECPPITLLTPSPARNADVGKRELDAMGVKLMEALKTFRVDGALVGRTTGPVVTQFEIEPAAGVKVRQFATLANDLALAMRAPSIRIVAPIPGRGAVGVEVPNPSPEMVALRELLDSRDFQSARAALPIALGKDLEGRAIVADLAKMPHLLIAGATGSGKSVCINTLITSLIFRHTPRTLRFLMIDPKMVELSVYNELPHLRHKVITDNRDAAAVLRWARDEMQERYELLAANGARNIQDFNRKVQEGQRLRTPIRPNVAFENTEYSGGILPYIVLVVDELADLMMTVQAEVETPLAILAQKARAIGIHIILATQRPSVNVITGLIKANFASRIAFRVASQIDSRTIIDGAGAEALLGNGDMLFIPPGKAEPARLQGAYISSEDTEKLMNWYIERRGSNAVPAVAEPDIIELMRKKEAEETGAADSEDAESGDRDKLFREAAEVVIQHQQGSTSLLQRRLKVGYGRAARIIDQLHAAGILGPPDGSKPRDVLAGLEDLDRIAPRT